MVPNLYIYTYNIRLPGENNKNIVEKKMQRFVVEYRIAVDYGKKINNN